jgi:hypothetical protein
MFISPPTGNFMVYSNSPLIDKGITITTINEDFIGNLRPQGNFYDIGPYEFIKTSDHILNSPFNFKILW